MLRELLNAQTAALDATTLDRLGRARRAALTQVGVRRTPVAAGWLAATAMAGLAALMLWPTSQPTVVPPAPVSMEAFSMLASPDEVELLESLDFYLWVETQDAPSDDHAG